MGEVKQRTMFEASGFFSIRTPLLPFEELLKWGEGLEAPSALGGGDDLRRAVRSDRIRLRSRMAAALTIPAVREALSIASPDIDERLELWMRDPEGKRGRGIELALVRYFVRMAGRATPFGLFAGCSIGKTGTHTRLVLEARGAYRRHTRLDMGYLCALTDVLGVAAELKEALAYRPNSSLYHAAGRIRYIESRSQGSARTHHLVAVDETDALDRALVAARGGAQIAPIVFAVVAGDPEITPEDARQFVAELIERQILVPDLQVKVTGPEALGDLIEQLAAFPGMTHVAARLEHVRAELQQLDAGGVGAGPDRYSAVAAQLRSLPAEVEPSRLFHVDMTKPMSAASLGTAPLKEIQRGTDLLHRLSRSRQDGLSRFREAFSARYGDREVPLVEALDEEMGIGYESAHGSTAEVAPLLRDLAFPPTAAEDSATVDGRHAVLLHKLARALTLGSYEVELGPEDLKEMEAETPLPLPDAFAACVVLAATSEAAVARGDFRVVMKSISGPSGAVFLGRFCHDDETLREQVERHLRAEEALAPDAVFAEVVHLPGEEWLGNILRRPSLRKYEIPFLGLSGAPAECQIPVTDLLVSVSDGRVLLRSARLGREVIPRLTSAHYYDHPQLLGTYRFLCALQRQGVASWLAWQWGPLERSPFLPRVSAGRLILSLARWNISRSEARGLSWQGDAERFLAVQEWRSERSLPRFVGLLDGDNKLLVDLDNALCVDALLEQLMKAERAVLEELYPLPEEMLSTGPEGHYVHELIVPFVRVRQATRHRPTAGAKPRPRALRTFAPGSEWLYVKLYTGSATADQLLRELISPAAAAAIQSGAADAWFFVRYGDPDWHLRLRLHGSPEGLCGRVLPSLHAAVAPLLAGGRLWRMQLDTYEREVERYGGVEAATIAERLFHADSAAVLDIINDYQGDEGAEARWRLGLLGADLLLSDLGFDLETKRGIVANGRKALLREFRCDAAFKRQLSEKYRSERKDLELLLAQGHGRERFLERGVAALRRRSQQIEPLVDELRKYERDGLLSRPVEELAASYTHMHLNRILRSAHRAQELVIYDFLNRIYESRAIRARGEA
ncbi:MAG TPA: lantibiotic dehydratase [Pyrinomonadaceae bacterium]